MSVNQTNVVDAISIDNVTGNAVLTISDHLPWSKEHLLLLQEKLNAYLAFVEGGELINNYPNAKDRDVQISIVCKYAPDDDSVSFLNQVCNVIESTGMKFNYQVLKK